MTGADVKTQRKTRRRCGESGFTLLELLVVLAILGLLIGIAVPQVMKSFSKAKTDTVRIQLDALASNIEFYRLDVGDYPSQSAGLNALVTRPADAAVWNGPYVTKVRSLTDPWGRPYQYRYPGEHGAFDIFSLGSDGRTGGEGEAQDVGNWQ